MVGLSSLFLDSESLSWLWRDVDGNVRAALICWGVTLSAFIVLRIPRAVLLGCLVAGVATVGLAATLVDLVPRQVVAGPFHAVSTPARYRTAAPPEAGLQADPATGIVVRKMPY